MKHDELLRELRTVHSLLAKLRDQAPPSITAALRKSEHNLALAEVELESQLQSQTPDEFEVIP